MAGDREPVVVLTDLFYVMQAHAAHIALFGIILAVWFVLYHFGNDGGAS